MLKQDLLQLFDSQSEVARLLNISRQYVSQWPEVVPLLCQYKLREKFQEQKRNLDKELAALQKGRKL